VIRLANKFDLDEIVIMLKRYRDASPLECHKDANDEDYIKDMLSQILVGRGIIFVSVDDYEELNGMLIAIRNPNIWDPKLMAINELCYWVNPESRGGTAGYRLLSAYKDYCEEAKANGQIHYYTISKMVTSPNLDYGRFGFNKLEEMWSH
jgi:hypothetical protein